MFCRICVLFGFYGRGHSRVKLRKLGTLPLSTYKKAKDDFKAHGNNEYHKNNVFKSDNFIDAMSDKKINIEFALDTAMKFKISENIDKS